jgi:hypothetical protein
VREQAGGLGLDQGGAIARTGALGSGAGGLVDRDDIIAVDDAAGEAIAGGAVGHVRDPHLEAHRHRDRVLVVLAEEDARQLVDAGPVAALVEVALAGRAVAEVDDRDGILPENPGGQRRADSVRDLGGDRVGRGEHVELARAVVAGDLAPARVRVGGAAKREGHDVAGRHAASDGHAQLAVGDSDVVVRAQRVGAAGLCGLLALARGHRRDPALALERPHALVEPAGQQQEFVECAEVVVRQIHAI